MRSPWNPAIIGACVIAGGVLSTITAAEHLSGDVIFVAWFVTLFGFGWATRNLFRGRRYWLGSLVGLVANVLAALLFYGLMWAGID